MSIEYKPPTDLKVVIKNEFKFLSYNFDKVRISYIRKADEGEITRLRAYWLKTYGVSLPDFTHIIKIRFGGSGRSYDYPNSIFEKIIEFEVFTGNYVKDYDYKAIQ